MDLPQAIESAIQGNRVELSAITSKTDSVAFVRALAIRFATETDKTRRERIGSLARDYLSGHRRVEDRELLAGLLRGSSLIRDEGTSRAVGILTEKGDPKVLASMSDDLLRALVANPFGNWLILVAHAKPVGALDVLQGMSANNPVLRKNADWKVAMAANGDQTLERACIDEFLTTDVPRRKMDLSETLRHIGTRKALEALAQEMRTPMVYQLGRVLQVPLRHHIAAQLMTAFPGMERISDLNTDEGYAKVEAFCVKEFGTRWTTERPPVEWLGPLEQGYQPIPMAPP